MRRAAAKHSSWISPRFEEYGPARGGFGPQPLRSRVGAGAKGYADAGLSVTDQTAKDLNIPVVAQALELLDEVYVIADDLGIGAEVRAAVTTAREASYASTILGNYLPSVASNAVGGALISGLGAVALVATVAVVVVAVIGLFSDDDDEKEARVKQSQAIVLRLRDRLTLTGFAEEQDKVAAVETLYGKGVVKAPLTSFAMTPAAHLAAAEKAQRFAKFYRASRALDADKRALFESVSNLGRWQSILRTYQAMSWPERDAVDVMFGKSAPRMPAQLKKPIEDELRALGAIVRRIQLGQSAGPTGAIGSALLVAAGAGLFYFLAPGLAIGAALGIWTGAKRAGSYVAGKAKGAVT